MTIISAAVEDNGWVLAVRGTWDTTSGAWSSSLDRTDGQYLSGGVDQFPLDADGTPKVVLSVRDAGFDRVDGLPVANGARPRTVVATKALRRAHPDAGQLDETDNGDGTRTVRLALSDRIYADSSLVSATFLAGWKAGEGAGVLATVANQSVRLAPLPIFRWANEPWALVQGTLAAPDHWGRVELIVATHHPEHSGSDLHQACAAVKLTAYDGTTSKAFFFAAPQTSPLYGDNLRCWGGALDLSGLSAGPITVHATVYPWVGAARETGNSHSTSITAALATAWGAPFHLFYDPDGTIWPRKYVAVDAASPNVLVSDSAQLAAVQLYDSPTEASAAPFANRPGSYSMALAKFGAAAPTMAGRNGFSSVARCCAWWEILLPAGSFAHGNALGASSGANAGPGQLIVASLPGVENPRETVVFGASGTARTNGAIDRIKFRNLRVALGSTSFFSVRTNSWASYENCDIRSDVTGGTSDAYSSEANTSQLQCDIRDRTVQPRGWFARNVVRTAALNTSGLAAAINVTLAVPLAGERVPDRSLGAFTGGTPNTADFMLWGCRAFQWTGDLFTPASGTFGSGSAGRRFAIVNTLYEGTGGVALQIGETENRQLQDSILEGVTLVGARFNFHNDSNYAGTSGNPAVRVANSPNTTIILGIVDHGLTTGDTVTITGFSNPNMNRTAVAVTVLDAHRFSYVASTSVTSAPGGTGLVTVETGIRAGALLPVRREDLRQTGNVIRFCSFNRNATKHDTFNNDGSLTGSWEVLYGVGYLGNVNANRGTASPQDFQYSWFGLGADVETGFPGGNVQTGVASWGVGWHGYVADRAPHGPEAAAPTYSGDYRADAGMEAPYKPSRLLGRGAAPACIDRDGLGGVRGATFAAGALGSHGAPAVVLQLQPDLASSPQAAASPAVGWEAVLHPELTMSAHSAGVAGLSVTAAPPPTPVGRDRLRLVVPEAEARTTTVNPD